LHFVLIEVSIISNSGGYNMQQLKMWWELQAVPEHELKKDFGIRTYRDGDADAWIKACSDGLDTGSWTKEDFKDKMLGMEGVFPEGIFFVTDSDGDIAGTATGVIKTEPEPGVLHMVCIRPEYRGKGLAKPLNAAVLNYLAGKGCRCITLNTDDFRIPAIKVYLSLGFRPILYDDDMPGRWSSILGQIGLIGIETFSIDGKPGPLLKARG
jgi:mycothiol synthase